MATLKEILPISNQIINEYRLAKISGGPGRYFYQTNLECSANYVLVKCNKCKTQHLLILGVTETQPTLYGGQLQGIWSVEA